MARKKSACSMWRYNIFARFYDPLMVLPERGIRAWRRLLWDKAEGPRILEVGAGTGANLPFHPEQAQVVAVDYSQGMLKRGQARAAKQGHSVDLMLMDVEHLAFKDGAFDSVVGALVFCSVYDPVAGLKEVRRVTCDGGKVVLLEHVRSSNRVMGWILDFWNPFWVLAGGEHITRKTVEHVRASGLKVEKVTNMGSSIFRLIEARKI